MSDDYKPLKPGNVPRTSLLHPEFRYVSSTHTDLRATFARVREELAKAPKPTPIKRRAA